MTRVMHRSVEAGLQVRVSTSVNCKLDLLAEELKCYGVAIAGIQETKWFGSDAWPATLSYTWDVLCQEKTRQQGGMKEWES